MQENSKQDILKNNIHLIRVGGLVVGFIYVPEELSDDEKKNTYLKLLIESPHLVFFVKIFSNREEEGWKNTR